MTQQVWLVTGVSSGLGRGIAQAAIEAGHTVFGTLRKAAQAAEFEALAPGRAHALSVDVRDTEAVDAAVAAVIEKAGRLDVVVNNAGYGIVAAIEEVSDEEAIAEMDTNLMGVLRVSRAAIPHLKAAGGGVIVNVGSVASAKGFPLMGLYAASKFAVAGLSQSLARELAPFGIKVTCIEPGGFRTKFGTGSMVWAANEVSDYNDLRERMRSNMKAPRVPAANDPLLGGRAIVALAAQETIPMHVALGADGLRMVTEAVQERLAGYDQHVDIVTSTTAVD